MKKTRISRTITSRSAVVLSLMALCTIPSASFAERVTLQLDAQWNTTGSNTGSVGLTPVSASVLNNWNTAPGLDNPDYGFASRFGTLREATGTTGDFFVISLVTGETETLTITLQGPLLDPTFFITDIDAVSASVTVPDGFDTLTNNSDGIWNGASLTSLSGSVQGTIGAMGAARYDGSFPAGTQFVFAFDFDVNTFSAELVGFGMSAATPVPGPGTAGLLLTGMLSLVGFRRRRSPQP